jgi:hypothetical protein
MSHVVHVDDFRCFHSFGSAAFAAVFYFRVDVIIAAIFLGVHKFCRVHIQIYFVRYVCSCHESQLSKWFCDTSTGAATGAARCGSFVGGGFGLLVASYG